MSSKSKITKNKNLRKDIKKNTFFQLIKKYKYQNQKYLLLDKIIYIYKLPTLYYKTKINNYCIITQTNKSIFKKFKISRIIFRQLVQQKYLLGVRKIN